MKIHYLQHVPFEGPGYIRSWAERNGCEITGTRLFAYKELPKSDDIDFLIIMGGPMSVHDEQVYPWLREEKEFIQSCIIQKKKILGICLGAQLIADVLGAEVISMKEKEIGWFPINWTEAERDHPFFDFLQAQQTVLHWHGDMFYLPDNALKLSNSEACENQAFLVDDHILALQFHLEMTREGLGELIKHSRDELTTGRFIQQEKVMLNEGHFEENHQTLEQIFNRFISL